MDHGVQLQLRVICAYVIRKACISTTGQKATVQKEQYPFPKECSDAMDEEQGQWVAFPGWAQQYEFPSVHLHYWMGERKGTRTNGGLTRVHLASGHQNGDGGASNSVCTAAGGTKITLLVNSVNNLAGDNTVTLVNNTNCGQSPRPALYLILQLQGALSPNRTSPLYTS